jgi:hypothetical protein
MRHGPNGIHQCSGSSMDPAVKQEERRSMDPTSYTGATAMAWTRQQRRRSSAGCWRGPSGSGGGQGGNGVDPAVEDEE